MLSSSKPPRRCRRLNSFTLVELLIVILIILLLAALTLAAGEAAMNAAARGRAKGEIQAISSSLENYKTDNGTYPWVNNTALAASGQTTFSSTADYSHNPGAAGDYYYVAAQVLYEGLSGQTNFEDPPATGVKSYMNFKSSELGNTKATANTYTSGGSTYVQDPFSYPYGYFTGTTAGDLPYNGSGLFDLWSTGGTTTATPNWPTTKTWISNFAP